MDVVKYKMCFLRILADGVQIGITLLNMQFILIILQKQNQAKMPIL